MSDFTPEQKAKMIDNAVKGAVDAMKRQGYSPSHNNVMFWQIVGQKYCERAFASTADAFAETSSTVRRIAQAMTWDTADIKIRTIAGSPHDIYVEEESLLQAKSALTEMRNLSESQVSVGIKYLGLDPADARSVLFVTRLFQAMIDQALKET